MLDNFFVEAHEVGNYKDINIRKLMFKFSLWNDKVRSKIMIIFILAALNAQLVPQPTKNNFWY